MLQCVCGASISDFEDYKIIFVKKDLLELDILCPNEYCPLRELGYLKFSFDKINKKVRFEKAKFYTPYVTWNVARFGKEKVESLLKRQLKQLVLNVSPTIKAEIKDVAKKMG